VKNPTRSTPRKRKSLKSLFYPSMPAELSGLCFAFPDDVSVSGTFVDWGPEFDAKVQPDVSAPARLNIRKIILSIEVPRPPEITAEERAAETERFLALPSEGRRAWLQELQRKMDAFDLYAKGGAQ
jgi:hypothetical protein